jgi:pimeloyl-ACP methyl ester carboxylesterase
VLIYAHTFSGNRIEGRFLFEYFFPNYAVCLFDFHGCGNAEGDYVTLGLREQFDLEGVIVKVQEILNPPRIYLWGRSMGAVTIIHLLSTYALDSKKALQKKSKKGAQVDMEHHAKVKSIIDNKVKAIVFDSPFTDAYKMIGDILKNEKNFSGLMTKLILMPVQRSIKSNVKIDVLGKNKPIKHVPSIKIPALFMIGERDTMVNQEHYKRMFDKYGADKKGLHYLIETDHSDCRNSEDVFRGLTFINSFEESVLEEKALLLRKDSPIEPERKNSGIMVIPEIKDNEGRPSKPMVFKPTSEKTISLDTDVPKSDSTENQQEDNKHNGAEKPNLKNENNESDEDILELINEAEQIANEESHEVPLKEKVHHESPDNS